MAEPGEPFPETQSFELTANVVARLQEVGDPARMGPEATQRAAVAAGRFVFTGVLRPELDHPNYALYAITPLDAFAIAHRGVVTQAEVRRMFGDSPPSTVDAPEEPNDTTPIFIPRLLLARYAQIVEAEGKTE